MDRQQPRELRGDRSGEPIPFAESQGEVCTEPEQDAPECPLPTSVDEIYETLETMNRSIRDLARELNCLGYFDDDDDRPKAA